MPIDDSDYRPRRAGLYRHALSEQRRLEIRLADAQARAAAAEKERDNWRGVAQDAVAILRTVRSCGLADVIERCNELGFDESVKVKPDKE